MTTLESGDAKWERMFKELCAYKKEYGHCNVPKRKFKELGSWVQWQRLQRKGYGTISQERIERLDTIGFVWNEYEEKWNKTYKELCEFKEQYGHCNVNENKFKKLGMWVSIQREQKKVNKMPKHRMDRLEEIGFVWDTGEKKWERRYQQLCEFHKKYGHCNVSSAKINATDNAEDIRGLEIWVGVQRAAKKGRRTISQKRIDRLEKLGFCWDAKQAVWNQRFEELKEFRQEHGHCNVPTVYPRRVHLRHFVDTQRQRYRQGVLSRERIAQLDSVGFNWIGLRKTKSLRKKQNKTNEGTSVDFLHTRAQKQWNESLDRLLEFKEEHGHWKIPLSYEKDTSLAKWVETQRENRLTMELARAQRLDSIGFPWDGPPVEKESGKPKQKKKRLKSVVFDVEEIELDGVRPRKSRRVDKEDCSVAEQEEIEHDFVSPRKSRRGAKRDGSGANEEEIEHDFVSPRKSRRGAKRDGSGANEEEIEHEGVPPRKSRRVTKKDGSVAKREEVKHDSVRPRKSRRGAKKDGSGADDEEVELDGVHHLKARRGAKKDGSGADDEEVELDGVRHGKSRRGAKKDGSGANDEEVELDGVRHRKSRCGAKRQGSGADEEEVELDCAHHRKSRLGAKTDASVVDQEEVKHDDVRPRKSRLGAKTDASVVEQEEVEHDGGRRRKSRGVSKRDCSVSEQKEVQRDGVRPRKSRGVSKKHGSMAEQDEVELDGVRPRKARSASKTDCSVADQEEVEHDSVRPRKSRGVSKKDDSVAEQKEVEHGGVRPRKSVVEQEYPNGTRVRKFIEGSGWRNGKVTAYNGKNYKVVHEDGNSDMVPEKEMESILLTQNLARIAIGCKVAVQWPRTGRYYKGIVSRERNTEYPFCVVYDKGQYEWIDFRKRKFRLLESGSEQESTSSPCNTPSERMYPIGTKVEKFYKDAGWYDGEVIGYRNDKYRVLYTEDNEIEEYTEQEVAELVITPDLAKVEVGSIITVFRPSDGTYDEAMITRERSNKKERFCLEFDFGDDEWVDLHERKFRLLAGSNLRQKDEVVEDDSDSSDEEY